MGGGQRLPYTHVDNCAAAVVAATIKPRIEGEAVNVVDDNLPTGRELIARYRTGGGAIRVLAVPQGAILPLSRLCEWYHRRSNGQLPAIITPYKSEAIWKPLRYSNAKAKALLGWKPAVCFAEGLEKTIAWCQAQGKGCTV
jgi:nucleoside-diphosphate-sugar epimerase